MSTLCQGDVEGVEGVVRIGGREREGNVLLTGETVFGSFAS